MNVGALMRPQTRRTIWSARKRQFELLVFREASAKLIGKERWPGVQVIPYAQDSLVAICSSKYVLAKSSSVRLEMLSHESFVDLTPERALWGARRSGFHPAPFSEIERISSKRH